MLTKLFKISTASTAEPRKVEIPTATGICHLPLEFNRHPRARRIRLTLEHDRRVRLTLPPGAPLADGLAFLDWQKPWLARRLESMAIIPDLRDFLQRQGFLSLSGRDVPVRRETFAGAPSFQWDGDGILWRDNPCSRTSAGTLAALRRLTDQELRKDLLHLAAQGRIHGLSSVSIRDQKSRWGSCSCRGGVSLNWRLVLLPNRLNRYIMWHELVHLAHMNHGKAFWSALEKVYPGAKAADAELNRRGPTIMGMGR